MSQPKLDTADLWEKAREITATYAPGEDGLTNRLAREFETLWRMARMLPNQPVPSTPPSGDVAMPSETGLVSVAIGACDNCNRAWPLVLLRHGSCSSGEGSFCPFCLNDSREEIADAIDEALDGTRDVYTPPSGDEQKRAQESHVDSLTHSPQQATASANELIHSLTPDEERIWKKVKNEPRTMEEWSALNAMIVAFKRRIIARHTKGTK